MQKITWLAPLLGFSFCMAQAQATQAPHFTRGSDPAALEVETNFGSVVLSSTATLEGKQSRFEQGWLILSWTGASGGNGTLEILSTGHRPETVHLNLGKGAGALVVSAQEGVFKVGDVVAIKDFVCGPQGSLCQYSIPELPKDSSIPCGPQGATCTVDYPEVDLDQLGQNNKIGPQS